MFLLWTSSVTSSDLIGYTILSKDLIDNMSIKLFVLLIVAFVASFALAVDANGELFLIMDHRLNLSSTGASCQLYGHSCLGGHGKRSDSSVELNGEGNLQSRLASQRMNALFQRVMSRRLSPDMVAAYMASASELSDVEKRSADYMQS